MKILLTGGGTGGHFYPLIAVSESINKIVKEEKLLPVKLYYMSDSPHDADMLTENGIEYVNISAGKFRIYFSVLNFFDLFKTFFGVVGALFKIFNIYPDVIFSKGGYSSFPVLVAAKLLKIPVVIHESDSAPGRTNLWAGKFAKRIAVSYPDASKYFDEKNVILVENNLTAQLGSLISEKTGAVPEYLILFLLLPLEWRQPQDPHHLLAFPQVHPSIQTEHHSSSISAV